MRAAASVILVTSLLGATPAIAGSVAAGSFQVKRARHVALTLADGDVLLVGGADDFGDTNAIDRYDVATGQWVPAARQLKLSAISGTVLASGKVIIAGNFAKSIYEYDPVANTWTTLGDSYSSHAAAGVHEYAPGKVIMAAGFRLGGDIDSRAETFDTVTRTPGFGSFLVTRRANQLSARLPDGRVMVAGGYHVDLGSVIQTPSTEIYSPNVGTYGQWTAVGSLNTNRQLAAVVTLADGRIMAIGGETEYGKTTEIFNPATLTWSPAAPMLRARRLFSATRLADGRVVVIGGVTATALATAEVEVYDPATNKWTWSVPLPSPRNGHSATLLPSGEVLVAGGSTFYYPELASALRYTPEPYDADDDAVADGSDNCPQVGNPDQANHDNDALGDACDPDDDNDGALDAADNCALVANADQVDNDADGPGDACDADDDNDGRADAADNCALVANASQADTDGDGIGDACEDDFDGDGVLDAADNCRSSRNEDQVDLDFDGAGDLCDEDDDADGVTDDLDSCDRVANPAQEDTDGDLAGDACDADDDGDGIVDGDDVCPLDAADSCDDEPAGDGGCSAAGGRGGAGASLTLGLGLALALAGRRRRRPRA
jgi:Thrombospondin type 3 repeat/Kelch motif